MEFWNVTPHGNGFALFSPPHLLWLMIFSLTALALCFFYRRGGASRRRGMEITAGALLLVLEAARVLMLTAEGQMSIGWLPLHYCGLSIFIEAWYAFRPRRSPLWGDILYATCMPGAFLALLTPDWTAYSPFGFLSCAGFLIHTLLVAFPLMLTVGGEIRPNARSLPKCLLFLAALALPMYFFDRATGMNFMFLSSPSPGSPLEWFAFLGSPGYILGYLPLIAAAWLALYLPWRLIRQKQKQP